MGSAPDQPLDPPRRAWPIVVGGVHRSGTSLLRRVLDAHSRIYCGPEVKFFRDFYDDYPNDPLRHLRFFKSARTIVPEAELLDVLGHAYIRVLEHAAAAAGKPRWADKNPENVRHLDQWGQLLGARWLFIHVVRNPLDTIASMKESDFALTVPADLDKQAAHYLRYTRPGLEFGVAHPARYYRVVYERLVAHPRQELATLMAWLGARLEPAQLDFNSRPHQEGLEDPKVKETRQIHEASLGRWQTDLTPEEVAYIIEMCGAVWRRIDRAGQYAAWPAGATKDT